MLCSKKKTNICTWFRLRRWLSTFVVYKYVLLQIKKIPKVIIFWSLIFILFSFRLTSPASTNIFIFFLLRSLVINTPQESLTAIIRVNYFTQDFLRWSLLILSCLIWRFSLLTFSSEKITQKKLFFLVLRGLIIILVLIFTRNSILFFYFVFEASLIPIAVIILGWGYQPERIQAILALILYTIIASFPLLVLLLNASTQSSIFFITIRGLSDQIEISQLILFFIVVGFLVKFPIFFVHLWLPKAHVEAPVIGSIILAALLLKLAGFGIWRISPLLFASRATTSLQSFSLLGGALVGVLCLRQIDIKVIIAYSSVRHIRFAVALLLSGQWMALLRSLFLIVAHGISSSAIFAGANLIYEKTHSRNLVLINGLLANLPKFAIFWFIACLGNMGTPPTINFLAEAWRIVALLNLNRGFIVTIALIIFFAVAFTLLIYASSVHGQPRNLVNSSCLINNQAWTTIFTHGLYLFGLTIIFI